ncbi:MAG: helix-turn-helix domain-containing protein [Hyphomicrobiales bacterium]|nr:helix-turn-helix domain-containing protein [Hyphomicrobiales bacterium]MDE2113343.1 helix-turn-helix domain-containing protein [Hyphomicrobiales bacterium]
MLEPNLTSQQFGSVRCFDADQEIFLQGQLADVFFKVLDGTVRGCRYFSDGKRQVDRFYRSGDIFGFEIDGAYPFTAEAVNPCALTVISAREVRQMAAIDQHLAWQLMSNAMTGMRRAVNHATVLSRRNAVQKVAAFLIEWAGDGDGGNSILLPMTHSDVADYLNLTVETISRSIAKLEQEGLIRLQSPKRINIVNFDALEALI